MANTPNTSGMSGILINLSLLMFHLSALLLIIPWSIIHIIYLVSDPLFYFLSSTGNEAELSRYVEQARTFFTKIGLATFASDEERLREEAILLKFRNELSPPLIIACLFLALVTPTSIRYLARRGARWSHPSHKDALYQSIVSSIRGALGSVSDSFRTITIGPTTCVRGRNLYVSPGDALLAHTARRPILAFKISHELCHVRSGDPYFSLVTNSCSYLLWSLTMPTLGAVAYYHHPTAVGDYELIVFLVFGTALARLLVIHMQRFREHLADKFAHSLIDDESTAKVAISENVVRDSKYHAAAATRLTFLFQGSCPSNEINILTMISFLMLYFIFEPLAQDAFGDLNIYYRLFNNAMALMCLISVSVYIMVMVTSSIRSSVFASVLRLVAVGLSILLFLNPPRGWLCPLFDICPSRSLSSWSLATAIEWRGGMLVGFALVAVGLIGQVFMLRK